MFIGHVTTSNFVKLDRQYLKNTVKDRHSYNGRHRKLYVASRLVPTPMTGMTLKVVRLLQTISNGIISLTVIQSLTRIQPRACSRGSSELVSCNSGMHP